MFYMEVLKKIPEGVLIFVRNKVLLIAFREQSFSLKKYKIKIDYKFLNENLLKNKTVLK